MKINYLWGLLFLLPFVSQAQESNTIIQAFLEENRAAQHWTAADISNWEVTDQHISQKSQVEHVYIRQTLQGLPVYNGVANFAIKDGKVLHMGNRMIGQLAANATATNPTINPLQAIQQAAQQLDLVVPTTLKITAGSTTTTFEYEGGTLSQQPIPVQLGYQGGAEGEVFLVWDLSIYTLDGNDWWSVKIDAQTGKIVTKNNWVHHCNFAAGGTHSCQHQLHESATQKKATNLSWQSPNTLLQPDQYTVFALPLESPSHGSRTMVVNPANSIASPFGWHDTNGSTGAEYTITRGNNVYAYDDAADVNAPGFSPDGNAVLEFNFPYGRTATPASNQAAAVTNLFYMNNMMHDIWYQYGFDEGAGNFQFNNYSNGGQDGDFVLAEAQDGGGLNNANFATPPDGNNPRMQMYLWSNGTVPGNFVVNSPAAIARQYTAASATFGPGWPTTMITANMVVVDDGVVPSGDGCEALINAAAVSGKIAIVDRGNCPFVDKVQEAQNAGAVAVLVINNQAGAPFQMGGAAGTITIPAVMISQADGNTIKNQLLTTTVNATFNPSSGSSNDGDFDNGVISHEYGHGISSRLSGGASTTNCLQNDEQMGEGWSDWFGLMLTLETTDSRGDVRGIGTYTSGQPTTGTGIRPAPYSTDFSINNYTYASSNNTTQISVPHGIGFVYCTALWEMTWDLIDQNGGVPDANLYTGTGGNNIAMNLVIESLKLQPCNPGMLDGRDAILAADRALYGGANQCLIWKAFARRGMGFSADQGSPNSRTDQTEAFDLPTSCQTPTRTPTASFSPSTFSSCQTTISFDDASSNVPQSWVWTFGDGNSSTVPNPTHTYTNTGSYSVKLVVSNTFGADSTQQTINISLPPAPTATDASACFGSFGDLIAVGSTGYTEWLDNNGTVIYTGDTLSRLATIPRTYYAQNVVVAAGQNIAPFSTNIGGGGYHSSNFYGALNFTAQKAFIIKTLLVDADGAGARTFYIGSGNNGGQQPANIVDQVTVNLVNGLQTVTVDLEIPAAGNYSIGGSNVDLFRNNSGANYPYTLPGYMTITSSSATTDPTAYYYYFYNMEIQDIPCISALDSAVLTPVNSNFSFVQNNTTVNYTDQSSGATSWFWDFGDGNTSTQQNPVHTYATMGNYTVALQINNGCATTQTVSVVTTVKKVADALPNVMLLPNPATNQTTLQLDKALAETLQVEVLDLQGKVLYQYNIAPNSTSLVMDLSELAAAIYIVKVKGKSFSQVRKLVVGRL